MADTRRPDKAPRGALAEGAERFDRLARSVKDSQLRRTKTGPRPAVTESFELSPEDAWAKKYMTHCIGPVCYTVEAMTEPPVFAKFGTAPEASVQGAGVQAEASEKAKNPPPLGRNAAELSPIGLVIGKPVGKRSWLGRLLGR
ncbi:MAG TPA: hypothetical protein VGC27_02890 [Rhizomicrobium sp.]